MTGADTQGPCADAGSRHLSHLCCVCAVAAVSSRDLRNNTAEVLRRVEAGERVQITVNRRPVAELVPLDRPQWVSGALMQRMLRGIAADPELLEELQVLREQVVEDPWDR